MKILLGYLIVITMLSSCCKSAKIDKKEIERMLDYLRAYPTFRLHLHEIKENEIVLARPYEKGRIVPVPGIWNDYVNTYEWIDATELLEQYFDDVEKIIRCTQGVDKVKWHVDQSEARTLYNFQNAAYTRYYFLASLTYGDTLGFRESFSDSLNDFFARNKIDIFKVMRDKIQPSNKFIQMGHIDDSTYVCPLPDSTKELLLFFAVRNEQWKISNYKERTIEESMK